MAARTAPTEKQYVKIESNISAVVTGGASGLGRASATALSAAGAKVAIFDLNEPAG
jgi:NAD(P)-dependent dehydrogenase (short-subunit alcohol dehydrogenase family)